MSYSLTRAVLGYLEYHHNAWYTVKEVAEGIQGNPATVRRTLNSLAQENAIYKDTTWPVAYKGKVKRNDSETVPVGLETAT